MKVQCDFIDVMNQNPMFSNNVDRIFERKLSIFSDNKNVYVFTNKPSTVLNKTQMSSSFVYQDDYVSHKIMNLKESSEINNKKYANSPIHILNEVSSLNHAHQGETLSQCIYDSLRLLRDRSLVLIDDEVEFNVYTSQNNVEELRYELSGHQIPSNVKIHLFDDNSQTFSSSITIHGQVSPTLPLNMSSYKTASLSPVAFNRKLDALTSDELDVFHFLSSQINLTKPLLNANLIVSSEDDAIINNKNTNKKRINTSTTSEQSSKYPRHFLLDSILDISNKNNDPIRTVTSLNQSSFFSNDVSERSNGNIASILDNKVTTREEKKEFLSEVFNNPTFKRKSAFDKHEQLNQVVAFFIQEARWLYSEYQLKVVSGNKKNSIDSEAVLLLIRDRNDKNRFTYKCLDLNNCEQTGTISINTKNPTLSQVLAAMSHAGCNITDEARLEKMHFCVNAANEYARLLTNDGGRLSDDNSYYLSEFNNNSSTSSLENNLTR